MLAHAPMLQRAVLITEGTTVSQIFVENVPSELTVTAADKVLTFV